MKNFLKFLLLGVLIGTCVWGIAYQTIVLQEIERKLFDGFFYLREPDPENLAAGREVNPYVSNRVQLIAIDERSLGVLGKWPWYRDVHAKYLDTVQKFSPEAVHFDVAFVVPERVPDSLRRQLRDEPEKLAEMERVFSSMDEEFGRALSRYDNDYIDLFVFKDKRPDSPYLDRIRFTESVMEKYAKEAEPGTPIYFHTLEPIVESLVVNSQPVTVSQWPDKDEVIRNFLVFHPYETMDGRRRNYFSVVLALLSKYYHLEGKEQVEMLEERVILHKARVPDLDRNNQPLVRTRDFRGLKDKIRLGREGQRYNRNLYHYLVNDYRSADDRENWKPRYPIHLLRLDDDFYELIDGREVYEAARDTGTELIDVVFHTETDVTINTETHDFGGKHVFPINFAGSQTMAFHDGDGKYRTHTTIPTKSYLDVVEMENLPDLPGIDKKGELDDGEAFDRLYRWYREAVREEQNKVLVACREKYGDLSPEHVMQYVTEDDPEDGRFVLYNMFFDDIESLVEAGGIASPAGPAELDFYYEQWLAMREISQDEKYFLRGAAIVDRLQGEYRRNLDDYYHKVVFTGPYTLGMAHDLKVTPYGTMYGVNVIINAFNTIVTENQLARSSDLLNVILLFAISMVFSGLYGVMGIRIKPYVFLFSFVAIFVVSYFLFFLDNFIVKTTPLALANAAAFITVTVIKVLTEEKDKRFLKATFSQYVSPDLIDTMYENKAQPQLGGSSDIITAFFSDVQSFSTFSEKLTAEQLVELLNEYLSEMTDVLLAEKGTLDKYEGDAIVAFFGAPLRFPDHALRACRVAIGMQESLGRLREKWRQDKSGENRNTKGLPPEEWQPGDKWPRIVHDMRMRIGINTGEIVTGNMGSRTRMNYTMMGDSVNLAARLEAGAKQYGVYTVLSEYTLFTEIVKERGVVWTVNDFIETRFLDKITVVGKTEPVRIYEVFCGSGDLSEGDERLIELFGEGVDLYRRMQWDAALEKFTEARQYERYPDAKTTPSDVYIGRCREFRESPPVPPGEDWDGVYRMTQK